jgi:alpha-amylase
LEEKQSNKVLDNNSFYTIAEVYNYGISGGQDFDFGDKKSKLFHEWFQQHDQFRIQMGCPERL